MNPAVERFIATAVVRRSGALIAIFGIAALLLLGFAEQGGIGSSLDPVPQQPLPFQREKVFGLDLSNRPSLNAVEWLSVSGSERFALVVLRVDADIISSLREPGQSDGAYRALDQLMASARDSNVALCLEQPVSAIAGELLAELTVDALRDRYPDRIAYVTSCGQQSNDDWSTAIATQVRASEAATGGRLLPLSTGAVVQMHDNQTFENLTSSRLRTFAGDTYVLPSIPVSAPLNTTQINISVEVIRDAAQIGLVLLQPDQALDGAALVESLGPAQLPVNQLPEGFSGVTSPALTFGEGWEVSTVGRVIYMRTNDRGAAIQAVFSGTTIYLQGLLAPGGGSISVWVDPDLSDPGLPDTTLELSANQAQDAALLLVEGLAAEDHTIVLVAEGGEVAVSGLFVKGQPAPRWNAAIGALALMFVTTAGMAVVGLARIQDIRRRNALPPSTAPQSGHPRAYRRDV